MLSKARIATKQHSLLLAWLVAVGATLASLSLSEIFNLAPCSLCWWQRIAMYPLAVILGIAYRRRLAEAWAYGLPLAVFGWVVALYHTLLQWGWLPKASAFCSFDNPCATAQIDWLGWLTIPFGSLLRFTAVIILLWLSRQRSGRG